MPKIKLILLLLTSVSIILLAYFVRVRDFAIIPLPGQSMDEYSNSWVGLSLIRLGLPVGLSGLPGYPFRDVRYINVDRVFQNTAGGNPFYLNYPWFDHPPLMGLITGGYAYMHGARVFEDTIAVVIRKPIIVMGIVSVVLTGILGYLLFGTEVALGSALLYATIPLVVLQSRFIQSENGLVICFLASLIFLVLYLKQHKYLYLFLAAFMAGIGTLFKLSGISIFLTAFISLYILSKKRIKDIVFFACTGFPIASLFIIYGAIFDWKTFINLLTDNSSRFYGLGMAAIQNLWLETRVTHGKTLTDNWPMTLWISLFIYLYQKRKPLEPVIPIAVVAYLAVYLFFGSWPYGWYMIPFWPLLTIVFVHFLVENAKNVKLLFVNSLLLSFPITQNLTRFIDIRDFQTLAPLWRFSFTSLVILLFTLSLKYSQKSTVLAKLWLTTLFILAIYLNLKFLGTINVDSWIRIN